MGAVAFLLAIAFFVAGIAVTVTTATVAGWEFWIARSFYIGAALLLIAAYFMWLRDSIRRPLSSRGMQIALGVLTFAAAIGGGGSAIYWTNTRAGLLADNQLADEELPGFAAHFVLNIQDVIALRRKYMFDAGTSEGARAAFYLSKSDIFVFSITDIHNESYSLEMPLGKGGISEGKFIYLICEVGVASNYSFMRVLVNGKPIEHKNLSFPISFGVRDWKQINLGSDSDHQNPGAFSMTEFGIWPRTFTNQTIEKLTENVRKRYRF